MKKLALLTLLFAFFPAPRAFSQQSLDSMIDREIGQMVSTYKTLHAAPELSHYEAKTSAFVADQLRSFDYTVTDHIGKYEQPNWKGYGVVAVLKNGDGPVVWVRSELDALPVEEKTDRKSIV